MWASWRATSFLHGIKQRIIESSNCHVAAEHRREPRYERIIMEKRGGYDTAAGRDFHRIRVRSCMSMFHVASRAKN